MNVKFQRFQKMYLAMGRSCPDEDKILDCAPLDSEEIEYPWRKQKKSRPWSPRAQGTTWSFNCASPSRLCPVAAMKTVLDAAECSLLLGLFHGVAKSVFTFYENSSVHIPEIVADCFSQTNKHVN